MRTVQFVLCDDQPSHNRTLSLMLQTVIKENNLDARIALTTEQTEQVIDFAANSTGETVYFLDICLDEQAIDNPNGITLCNGIRARNPNAYIIYVSAYQQFALDCCHTHAFDFIVKPFSLGQLTNCVLSVFADISTRKGELALYVTAGSRTYMIDQSDIVYFDKKREYVTAHLNNAPEVVWREGFSALSERLVPGLFFQIHKSYLVNIRHIDDVDWGEGVCKLSGGAQLRISRRREPALRALLTGEAMSK